MYLKRTKLFVELVVELVNKGRQIQGINLNDLIFDTRAALTSVGIRHGLVGSPNEVDVNLRQLLTTWNEDHPQEEFISGIFKDLIRGLDQDINRSMQRGQQVW
ncbi:MAG: hypothetical protein DI538_15845 [Azospira oryzae]|jgi:hypothetical protein|nr:MAG: hypothetical protein DI538_15845 [Azospira oryzae]